MSHLSNPTTDLDNKLETKYDPKEYRRLAIRKNFWFVFAMLAIIGWAYVTIVMFVSVNWIGVIAMALGAYGIWLMIMKSSAAHLDASPIERTRKEVRDAYRFARHHAMIEDLTWPVDASYTMESKAMAGVKHWYYVIIKPRDSKMASFVYEISPTSVSSIGAPEFKSILPDLKNMTAHGGDVTAFNKSDGHLKSQFKPASANVQPPIMHASPRSLQGD